MFSLVLDAGTRESAKVTPFENAADMYVRNLRPDRWPAGVAAVLGGIGGVVTAAVAQVGSWFRRSLRGNPKNCSA